MESAASTSSGPSVQSELISLAADGWPSAAGAFGQAVSEYIDRHDLPVLSLAKEAGLSVPTLRSVRKGEHRPTRETRRRLIDALGRLAAPISPAPMTVERAMVAHLASLGEMTPETERGVAARARHVVRHLGEFPATLATVTAEEWAYRAARLVQGATRPAVSAELELLKAAVAAAVLGGAQ